jgi:hypothetical protein
MVSLLENTLRAPFGQVERGLLVSLLFEALHDAPQIPQPGRMRIIMSLV